MKSGVQPTLMMHFDCSEFFVTFHFLKQIPFFLTDMKNDMVIS